MMTCNAASITSLVLRISTSICLLVSLVVLATDKLHLIDGTKMAYTDVHGYRYVLAITIISFSYTILQLGVSTYQLVTEKIPFWDGLPQLTCYLDQVITWVLASAVGAGFAVSVELQRLALGDDADDTDDANDDYVGNAAVDEQKSIVDDFFNRGNIASGILLVAFISMAALLLLSTFSRTKAVPVETKAVEEAQAPAAQAQDMEAQPVETPSN